MNDVESLIREECDAIRERLIARRRQLGWIEYAPFACVTSDPTRELVDGLVSLLVNKRALESEGR